MPAATTTDLLGLPRAALAEALAPVVDRPYRVEQIYQALYARAVPDFSAMTELSKELRARLEERFHIGNLKVSERRLADDGTCKVLFRLGDGATIEAVDIPDRGRHTFCISSQAGCALACTFCVTGYWGAGRDLTAGEIVGQVLALRADRGLPMEGLNLVFMGMGEPLLNLANVRTALDLLTEWISPQRITVSTVGLLPGLEEMARWEKRPNLAISLHAPDDPLRSALVPLNRKYPIAELLAACRRYPGASNARRITFEYVMLRGVNDSEAEARELVRLIRGIPAKVNLIPFNPWPGAPYECSDWSQIEAFAEIVNRAGYASPVRTPRGRDIMAACGQLKSASERARKGGALKEIAT